MSDNVYVLSATYSGDSLMYAAYNRLGSTIDIKQANVHPTREAAENELAMIAGHWQIQPISKKKLSQMRPASGFPWARPASVGVYAVPGEKKPSLAVHEPVNRRSLPASPKPSKHSYDLADLRSERPSPHLQPVVHEHQLLQAWPGVQKETPT